MIVFTDHINNTFNGLKASECFFLLAFILEEYGVTFLCLSGREQKNIVADTLSCLDIDSLKIQEKEVLILL
jgi:hypothetical protein